MKVIREEKKKGKERKMKAIRGKRKREMRMKER